MITVPVMSALAASGCAASAASHPWVEVSDPASEGEARRRAVVESTARRDLECTEPRVTVALHPATGDDSAWEPLLQPLAGRPRYVVEGCGKRGLYVESCAYVEDFAAVTEDVSPSASPSSRSYECRYLLVSVIPTAVLRASMAKSSGEARGATAPLATDETDAPDAGGSSEGALGF